MNHGHVIPNEDGSRTRCGGPGICSECSQELASAIRNKTHAESKDCWCHPVLSYKDDKNGNEVWAHNDVALS